MFQPIARKSLADRTIYMSHLVPLRREPLSYETLAQLVSVRSLTRATL